MSIGTYSQVFSSIILSAQWMKRKYLKKKSPLRDKPKNILHVNSIYIVYSMYSILCITYRQPIINAKLKGNQNTWVNPALGSLKHCSILAAFCTLFLLWCKVLYSTKTYKCILTKKAKKKDGKLWKNKVVFVSHKTWHSFVMFCEKSKN